MPHILLVEDEESIREVERLYLEQAGFTVHEAETGEAALELWRHEQPDIVVLDLNLPGTNGIEVCKEIRVHSLVPIIMVTARVEEIDELLGLEIGADDYLKKPFSAAILIARVQALLRRQGSGTRRFGKLTINTETQQVWVDGTEKRLTTTQFQILNTLTQKPGKVFTRNEILDRAYREGERDDIFDRTIDAHIKAIRRSLGDNPHHPTYIKTIIGSGYSFAP